MQIYINVDIANSIGGSSFLSRSPSEVELRISQYGASYYKNKAKQTASSRLNNEARSKKKSMDSPRQKTLPMLTKNESSPDKYLVIIDTVDQFSIEKASNLYNDAKIVGKISFNRIKRMSKKVRTRQTLTVEKINQNLEQQEKLTKSQPIILKYLKKCIIV